MTAAWYTVPCLSWALVIAGLVAYRLARGWKPAEQLGWANTLATSSAKVGARSGGSDTSRERDVEQQPLRAHRGGA